MAELIHLTALQYLKETEDGGEVIILHIIKVMIQLQILVDGTLGEMILLLEAKA